MPPTLRSEAIVPEVERVMRMIAETPEANGMFIAVTWDEENEKLWVEMRSHWTTLGCADAAVRAMMQVVLDAVQPLAKRGDREARECFDRYSAALHLVGGAGALQDFDVTLPQDIN